MKKNIYLILSIVVMVIAVLIVFLVAQNAGKMYQRPIPKDVVNRQTDNKVSPTSTQVTAPVVCTDEAKQCPDGSYVGRTEPNCEFATCPVAKKIEDPVANSLCRPTNGSKLQLFKCGDLYIGSQINVADSPTAVYDSAGKILGHCGGMPGPDGSFQNDEICKSIKNCSMQDLCNPQ